MSSEIQHLVGQAESETLEHKGPNATVADIARDVCAFLNQQGGVIVCGVTEADKIIGMPDAVTQQKHLTEFIAHHIRPRPLLSISVVAVNERQLLLVDVPPGSDKPYALDREIWIRIATGTLRASAAASTELVGRSATELERWERESVPGFAVADCDHDELARTRVEFQRTQRFGSTIPETDEDLIRSLNLGRSGQLTNACVVLFARNPREWSPSLSLRITTSSENPTSSLGQDSLLEGPAVRIVQEAIALIRQRTGSSGEFRSESLQREDRPAYPLFALREAIVNAVVHRNYAALGEVRIQIQRDQLVVQNPGSLPQGWTVKDLKTEHVSKPTNPDIARSFYLRGLMEQLGMGTQRLIAECKAVGARTPIWAVERGMVSLRIFQAPARSVLSPRLARFLRQAPAAAFVMHDYVRTTEVSERQARRDLQELERLGLVERQGKGPSTSYRMRALLEDRDEARESAIRRVRKEAPTSDREAAKSLEAMVRWFFERYEDPANGVPYDGREGGYQYVAGGPYDAEEELRDAFDDGSEKRGRLIKAAASQIESSGTEWVRVGEY